MLGTLSISARELLRNYRGVAERVQKTGDPIMVTSQKKPQVAIVTVKDLEVLQDARGRRSTQATMRLVGLIPEGSGLPKDLAQNHDKYAWG